MQIKELTEFNLKMFKDFINREDDLYGFWNNFEKVLDWFNGNTEIHIFKFGDLKGFVANLTDWDELVEFNNFYKKVGEDLSDSYYFKEPFEPIGFVEDSESLVELLEAMIGLFDKEEAIAFNRFMVGLVF